MDKPLEIEEPVNITIESRQQTEEKQRKTEAKDKRVPTPKQIEQLKKAREAKAIKKKAIELTSNSKTPEMMEISPTVDYTQYITPLICLFGTLGGIYVFKKKISTSCVKNTQEPQENYSKLQLNF